MKCLKLVFLKDAAVEIGDFSEQAFHLAGAFGFRFREPLKEKWTEEVFVVSVDVFLLAIFQLVAQIIYVVVQKTFPLDEVDEHQTVEHHRGVPALHLFIGNAVEEFEECVMLFLETVIKLLGNSFSVKGCSDASGHVNERKVLFLFKSKDDGLKFLNQSPTRLFVTVIPVFTACVGFSLLVFDPLPNLCGFVSVGIDDKMFVDGLCDLLLNFAAGCVIGDTPFGCRTFKNDHPAFFDDGGEFVFGFIYCDIEGLGMIIPTEYLCKERFEFRFFKIVACFSDVKHWRFPMSSCGFKV